MPATSLALTSAESAAEEEPWGNWTSADCTPASADSPAGSWEQLQEGQRWCDVGGSGGGAAQQGTDTAESNNGAINKENLPLQQQRLHPAASYTTPTSPLGPRSHAINNLTPASEWSSALSTSTKKGGGVGAGMATTPRRPLCVPFGLNMNSPGAELAFLSRFS